MYISDAFKSPGLEQHQLKVEFDEALFFCLIDVDAVLYDLFLDEPVPMVCGDLSGERSGSGF